MATLDPRIEEVRKQYGLSASDFWELPQKRGTWVAKHAALEVAAVKAGIAFDMPQVLEANGPDKSVAICVMGQMGDRREWSIGEASPANNKNSYPYAMAEKRGKDRVILKLIGLNGLAYSEDESDDFKQPVAAQEPEQHRGQQREERNLMEPDIDAGTRNWLEDQKKLIRACSTLEDVQGYIEGRGPELDRMRRKNLAIWNELRLFKEARIQELQSKKGQAA